MSDSYDYYPCKIKYFKKNPTNTEDTDKVVAILDVNFGYGKTANMEYKAKSSSTTSKDNTIISLKPTTNPLYLRMPKKKSNEPKYLLIWKTSNNRATF